MAVFQVSHLTHYQYSQVVKHCHSELRLKPREDERQKLLYFEVFVEPKPHVELHRVDYFGNHVLYLSLDEPHQEFRVLTKSLLEIEKPKDYNQVAFPYQEIKKFLLSDEFKDDIFIQEYLLPSPFCPIKDEFVDFIYSLIGSEGNLLQLLSGLGSYLKENFIYDPHFTNIHTPIEEVWAHKRGVCQDFAHLCISFLRSVGVPTRYVSGYLETHPPPGKEKLRGADASHAWISAFDPHLGWLDFDPTNNKFPDDSYIVLAYGRDYSDVTPVKGVIYEGGKQILNVAVDVDRVNDREIKLFTN